MRTLCILLTFLFVGLAADAQNRTWVNGYYTRNGTYVQGYWRTLPDANPYNNYSTPGNYNPNTGTSAPGDIQRYLERYYEHEPRSTDVWVNPYLRKDGTLVEGHYRTAPNGNPLDNYSFPGNLNPYTGEVGKGSVQEYLQDYNLNSDELLRLYLSCPELFEEPADDPLLLPDYSAPDYFETPLIDEE